LWGKKSIDFGAFRDGVKTFQMYNIRKLSFKGSDRILGILYLSDAVEEDGESTHVPFHHALSLSSLSKATEPRDKIFGILGLCFDGSKLVPSPDYQNLLIPFCGT
jgi:hypothetical protein